MPSGGSGRGENEVCGSGRQCFSDLVPARVAGLVSLCDVERVPQAYRADKDDLQHAHERRRDECPSGKMPACMGESKVAHRLPRRRRHLVGKGHRYGGTGRNQQTV